MACRWLSWVCVLALLAGGAFGVEAVRAEGTTEAATTPAITAADLKRHVEMLASDAFEGRADA